MEKLVDTIYPTITEAMHLMMNCHRGQTRDGGSPYWVHPWRVYTKAVAIGVTDIPTLETCLLHDVLEDCADQLSAMSGKKGACAVEYLRSIFPHSASAVIELTNDATLNRSSRRLKMLQKARFLSDRARTVKALDRTDNVVESLTSYSHDRLWKYFKESVFLERNLRAGIGSANEDGIDLRGCATKAVALLKETLDRIAYECYYLHRISQFAEYWFPNDAG